MIPALRRTAADGETPRIGSVLGRPQTRAVVWQTVLAAAVLLSAWYLVSTAVENLRAAGIASGFAFLRREAGFAIGETTVISYSATDTYLRALAAGFLNTFRVAGLAIVLSTVLGVCVGLARLSPNWLLARLAGGYVEVLRNVPLVVQLFFWYAVITEILPAPGDALNPIPGVFLSNRGVAFPLITLHPLLGWFALGFAVALAIAGMIRGRIPRSARARMSFLAAAALLFAAVALTPGALLEAPFQIDHARFSGFNFSGGGMMSPEFAALLIGLALYTAAFIGEIVRAGILSVDRGQFEAAHSLGHSQGQALRFIILPQALRLIVPPVTSQYLNCTKNSSLAVAIGYPDLVSIANTTINQTGQAIEGIAIIMFVYLTISLAISAFMNGYNRRFALRGGTR